MLFPFGDDVSFLSESLERARAPTDHFFLSPDCDEIYLSPLSLAFQ